MVGRVHPAEAPQRGNRNADAHLYPTPRPSFNRDRRKLPDPNTEHGRYLYELRARMRERLAKFVSDGARVTELNDWHTRAEADDILGHLALLKDGEIDTRASGRDSAHRAAITFGIALLAELAVDDWVASVKGGGRPLDPNRIHVARARDTRDAEHQAFTPNE